MRVRTPPARPDCLSLEQLSALVVDLPHCKLIRGGRALQLVDHPDPRELDRPYRPLMAILDAFLIGLDRGLSHATILLARGQVSVELATPGVGVTPADIETARLIVQRWATTK